MKKYNVTVNGVLSIFFIFTKNFYKNFQKTIYKLGNPCYNIFKVKQTKQTERIENML